ncbi:uncharacterized protein LOC131697716 isoform X1 [Acipenser ruthenus]|uniref:uncharacterized protein LOC131697716 isoform X1 n=1 Tax=Acipenser ruthenus TaxID=7906 RepID=UPI002741AE68|nr:uncharacterized protein LOC131697716 isoform X1 [Acipenser ruthenus]
MLRGENVWSDLHVLVFFLFSVKQNTCHPSARRRAGRERAHSRFGCWSGAEASRLPKKAAAPLTAKNRLVQGNQEAGSVRDRPRPGRQRVTTPAQDHHIRLIHLCNRVKTTATSQPSPAGCSCTGRMAKHPTAVYPEADQVSASTLPGLC